MHTTNNTSLYICIVPDIKLGKCSSEFNKYNGSLLSYIGVPAVLYRNSFDIRGS